MKVNISVKKIFIIVFLMLFALNFSVCYANDTEANTKEPSLRAKAAVLMDSSSGKIFYRKNENKKMYPASTTKIMTAILTIENCKMNDIVTVPYEAISTIPSGYSIANLKAGEQLTVSQVLQLMLVHSANDAANALAYHVSGDVDTFASLMNKKVEELGLKGTHFTNAYGKHADNHYTTAHDLALIMKYCMKNKTFRSLTKMTNCKIPATNKSRKRFFTSTNELLDKNSKYYYYSYAIGGKTGYTTEAQNCLVSVSKKDNFELISVVLHCDYYKNWLSAKFVDSKKLFEYGYSNYSIQKIREKNAIATQISISNGTDDTKNLDLLINKDIYAITNLSTSLSSLNPEIQIMNNLSAPIAENQVVGTITYTIDNEKYSANLVAAHNVEKRDSTFFVISIVLVVFIMICIIEIIVLSNSKKKNLKKKNSKKK